MGSPGGAPGTLVNRRLIPDVAVSPPRPGWREVSWLPAAVLLALAAVCFAQLIMHPGALIVDGREAQHRPCQPCRSAPDRQRHDLRLPPASPLGRQGDRVIRPSAFVGSPRIWRTPARRQPASGALLSTRLGRLVGASVSAGLADRRPSDLGRDRSVCALALDCSKALGVDGGGRRLSGFALPAGAHVRGTLPARLGGGLVSLGILGVRPGAAGPRCRVAGTAASFWPWRFWRVIRRNGCCSFWRSQPGAWPTPWQSGARIGARPAALRLFVWGGAAALSLGMTAIDLAPQLAVRPWLLRDHDVRARMNIPRRYHLEALNGFQLLSPTALGGPADYFGNDNYWETLLSIGLVPLLLAMVAVIAASEPQARPRVARARGSGILVRVRAAPLAVFGRLFHRPRNELVSGAGAHPLPRESRSGRAGGAGCASRLRKSLPMPRAWRRFAGRCGLFIILVVATLYLVGPAREFRASCAECRGGSTRARR